MFHVLNEVIFMKKLLSVALIASSVFFLNGCSMSQFEQQTTQIIQKQLNNVTEFTITEGKTTKQEVLDKLGNPSSMDSSEYRYSYFHSDKPNEQLNLRIIKKDNTTFNVVFSNDDADKKYLNIHFDEYSKNPNVVSEVSYM